MTSATDNKGSEVLSKPVLKNGYYNNPWKTWTDLKFLNIIKYYFFDRDESNIPGKQKLDETLPVLKPNLKEFNKCVPTGVRTMWIGHASVLIRFDNITVLTDPVFSERCSMVSYMGPQRYRSTPCKIKDLPKIDAVVISHNHYDHLDLASVKELNERFDKELRWYVPQGMKTWMTDTGCKNVVEMTWWQEDIFPGKPEIKFVSTPAQHWSKRGLTDTCKTLWCSWSVIGPNHSFYFAGDTGYCDGFKEIGKKYGPFTLAAIPIGCYKPRWFMHPQHVDPTEAVDIHVDLQAKHSLGIHWGTFKLAYEPYMEPKQRLAEEIHQRNMEPDDFFTLHHGEIKTIGSEPNQQMD